MIAPDHMGQALPITGDALAQHYKDVESFQSQRVKSVKRLSKVMLVVTVVALLGNLAQAWTLACLFPLSKIVPVYLWVRPDGTIDSSVSMSQLPPTQNKAVIDASLWEYVRLRESYSFDTARYGYEIVSNYSSPAVASQYQQFFNYPNPESPQVTVGKHGSITVNHISSSDIGPALKQIRFSRTTSIDGKQPLTTTMTATIGYATVRNLPAGLRLTNPGGLLVTSYQFSEDTPK